MVQLSPSLFHILPIAQVQAGHHSTITEGGPQEGLGEKGYKYNEEEAEERNADFIEQDLGKSPVFADTEKDDEDVTIEWRGKTLSFKVEKIQRGRTKGRRNEEKDEIKFIKVPKNTDVWKGKRLYIENKEIKRG